MNTQWMNILVRDPYRILFPIALLNLCLGVGIWIPAMLGDLPSYPILEHMTMTMQASFGCFVFGFVLTLLPRLWDADSCDQITLYGISLLYLSFPLLLVLQAFSAMYIVILLAHLLFIRFAILRWRNICAVRIPFLFVIYVGLLTSSMTALGNVWVIFGELPTWCAQWVLSLQTQGTLLIIVCGVAPILVTRIGGGAACFQTANDKPLKKFIPGILACVFAASYILSRDYPMITIIARALIAGLLLNHAMTLYKRPLDRPWFLRIVWLSFWSILIGILLPAFAPAHTFAWDHLIFISGFVLLTLMVSARVVCGHGGDMQRVEKDVLGVLGITFFIGVATICRVSVDWFPESRPCLLGSASTALICAVGIWVIRYGILLLRTQVPKH